MMPMHRKLSLGEKANFECLRCGRCCSGGPNVGLTAFDVLRIANYLGLEWRKLRGRYVAAVIADFTAIPILMDKGDGRCVFLENADGKAYCRIYPVRPMRCRLYPFLPISPGNDHAVYLNEQCPGTRAGVNVEPPWNTLESYNLEAKIHYAKIYRMTFRKGLDPLEALEKTLDEIAELTKDYLQATCL